MDQTLDPQKEKLHTVIFFLKDGEVCYYEHTKMTMSVKIHYRYMFNSVKLIVIDILHLQKLLSAHPTISKRISV